MSFIGLNSITFTANSSWVCPPNITHVLVIACGGGGGGGCADGEFSAGAGGGGGSLQQTAFIETTPEETHTIIIGAGGAGGVSGLTQDTFCGLDGYSTSILNGETVLFSALGGGGAGVNQDDGFNHGGVPWASGLGSASIEALNASPNFPGSGGGWTAPDAISNGMMNLVGGFPGGLANFDVGSYGAAGGGAGPKGPGGNGGSLLSPNGVDAGDNTGAGGGGGNTGSTSGGAGGSGYLTIIW